MKLNNASTDHLPAQATRFTEILRKHLPDLRQRYAIQTLARFGSYIRGDQHAGSDLDVLVEFAETPTLFDLVDLGDDLEALVGVRVDLTMRQNLGPRAARNIRDDLVPV